jgi:hypothetical protein
MNACDYLHNRSLAQIRTLIISAFRHLDTGHFSNMGFKLVLAALSAVVASVAAYSIGATSPFLTGTMNAGLRMPAAVSSLGVAPQSYR